jgi:hypothetical protein
LRRMWSRRTWPRRREARPSTGAPRVTRATRRANASSRRSRTLRLGQDRGQLRKTMLRGLARVRAPFTLNRRLQPRPLPGCWPAEHGPPAPHSPRPRGGYLSIPAAFSATSLRARARFPPLGLRHMRTGVPERYAVLNRFEPLIGGRRKCIGRTASVLRLAGCGRARLRSGRPRGYRADMRDISPHGRLRLSAAWRGRGERNRNGKKCHYGPTTQQPHRSHHKLNLMPQPASTPYLVS